MSAPIPRTSTPDASAFQAFFKQHYRWTVRTVAALGISAAEAEDVAQEVFVIAFRQWSTRDAITSDAGWLFGVARRVCANQRRSRKRAAARDERAEGPHASPLPDTALEQRNAAAMLQEFLDGLPEGQRAAFVLYEMNEMNAPEAARVLGIAPDTVHSHVRLVRRKLERLVAQRRARLQRESHG